MRYALYYVPEQGSAFNNAGAGWLGRDAYGGPAHDQPAIDGLDAARIADLTMNARRYGFHATLKAPAPLAAGCSEADYFAAVSAFCKQTAPVALPRLTVGKIGMTGSLFALVPDKPHVPLNALEQKIVAHFEPWRGGLNDEAKAWRNKGGLTDRQNEMLDRWGYAFAVDEFRFHITLTDRIPDEHVDAVASAIEHHFSRFLNVPLAIDRLGIFVEGSPGAPFRILESFALEGEA